MLYKLNIGFGISKRKKLTKGGYNAFDFLIQKRYHKKLELCLFNGKYEKSIPNSFRNMNAKQFEIFLETFIQGDGYKPTNNCFQIAGSKENLTIIQELCVRYGYTTSLYPKKNKNAWILTGTKRKSSYHIIAKTIEYNDLVWCVSVPNQTIVIRYNGKTSIVGNCKWKSKTIQRKKKSVLAINVGIDVWDYTPVSADILIGFIKGINRV